MARANDSGAGERLGAGKKGALPKPPGPAGAGAPRKPIGEQREAPLRSNLRSRMSDEELRQQIAETAYYKAQSRGFAPGYEERDWLEAEAEVLTRLGVRQS